MATAADELSEVFAALADPTRRAILARLTSGSATVNELAEPFAISQQAVSNHLKVLEQARLITRERVAQSRPCTLEPERLGDAVEWIDRHRRLWADRHDQLAEHLAVLASRTPEGRTPEGEGR